MTKKKLPVSVESLLVPTEHFFLFPRVLCEGGAEVSTANAKGDTPLHDAVSRGDLSVVRRLLQYGGDPAAKNVKGMDCYELAKGKPDVLQSLSMHKVSQNMRKSSTDSLDSLEVCLFDFELISE